MKILIYGSKGWIGNQFLNYLNNGNLLDFYQKGPFLSESKKNILNNLEIVEGAVRLNNFEDLKNELDLHKPDSVISFIGRTHGTIDDKVYSTIDYLEQKDKVYDNVRDNLYSPISLALLCKDLGIHYTYLGTGCIFDYRNEAEYGKEINGFTEKDIPNFYGSSYSVVKGFTDMLMHQLEENVLNLRIRMPIVGESNPRNFITKISKYQKICSIPNSMTVLPDFYPVILDLILNKTTGTLNLTNPGLISHNEILEMYRDIVDNSFTWENFTIEEQNNILDSKRSNNFLCTKKLEWLYPNIKDIKVSVKDILNNYKLI
uniref:NAD dependent epimerase/dehydratase family protein n=1 Tax=Mimiviridae sp. ChoanoV1 TaxID=2596887 RepID=A0A5B8INW7_9VIRU|nr:hypothetical protein 1_29 [Mimiviridae sp. ChoanoV1]